MVSMKLRARALAARGALVVGATAAVLGLGGLGATSAMASASCEGNGITGEGASVQRLAQQNVWAPGFAALCEGVGPSVTYLSTNSGAGLSQWSAFGGEAINHEREFIGTTMAPNATEIENIRTATGKQNGAGEKASVLTIPVAQTAIAVVANPPVGCTIGNVKAVALQRIFRGGKKEWSDIGTASGKCNSPIVRVVPADVSGTTYQFKHYLYLNEPAELPCLPGSSWASLQAVGQNGVWPEACKGHMGLTTVQRSLQGGTGPAAGSGGVDEVETVNATAGSIGFAALPDAETAKTGGTAVLAVQNGNLPGGKATFAAPAASGAAQPNCSATAYAVPASAQPGSGTSINSDWSQVYGSSLESATYPICTLTWDLALRGYIPAGFEEEDATTVKDYFYWYLLSENQGEEELAAAEAWYAPLPETGLPGTDVAASARLAASRIQ